MIQTWSNCNGGASKEIPAGAYKNVAAVTIAIALIIFDRRKAAFPVSVKRRFGPISIARSSQDCSHIGTKNKG
jgi:hypothetical protein